MADVERQWEAGCVPHGAREVDGSGADAEGGFRHPQPSAADVERERVTALWQQAVAALEPSESMWNTRTLALCLLAGPTDGPVNVGLARDLARAALDSDAECGRLREHLDAADKALIQAYEDVVGLSMAGFDSERSRLAVASVERIERARAALGVVGEQE